MRRKIRAWIVAGLVAATMALTAMPASAATYLGPMNLDQYCKANGYWGVVLETWSPYGWKCHIADYRAGIDMNAVCRWQYGYQAYAKLTSNSPYGWYCYK